MASFPKVEMADTMVSDEELRRRLELLRDRLESGKFSVAAHLADDLKKSLAAVKKGLDGEIDLSTVDGRIRSMAMMVAMIQDRDDLKNSASLADIQNAYFSRVESVFGEVYKGMVSRETNPQALSWAMSRDEKIVDEIKKLSLIS